MIAKDTGVISFDDDITFVPHMLFDPLLCQKGNLTRAVENGRYQSYQFGPVCWQKTSFFLLLQFVEGRLEDISLAKERCGGWGKYSADQELADRRWYSDLLHDLFGDGPPYRFPWGEVTATTDPKNGDSKVVVRFAPLQETAT